MRAVIFGANGQDGFYLDKLLFDKQIEVIKVSRKGPYVHGNVGDWGFVESLIKEKKPEFIFHFAAKSTTSHTALKENHEAICTGAMNILEATRLHCPSSKIFLSGSAMQFKNDGKPINEKTAFEANSAYSASRIHSVYTGRYYRDKHAIKVYVGYLFNHDSSLRSEQHVNQKIVKAVQRIRIGSCERIDIGDMNVRKEFNFAGDIVNAIWALIKQDNIFEAVIGSGEAYSIKEWVKICFDKIGKNYLDYIVSNGRYNAEYNLLVSDPKLIYSIGWSPETSIYQLADIMIENRV